MPYDLPHCGALVSLLAATFVHHGDDSYESGATTTTTAAVALSSETQCWRKRKMNKQKKKHFDDEKAETQGCCRSTQSGVNGAVVAVALVVHDTEHAGLPVKPGRPIASSHPALLFPLCDGDSTDNELNVAVVVAP